MISNRQKTARAYRTINEAPLPQDSSVDFTLFANYYGSVEKSYRFNDPALYTDKPWYTRLVDEIRAMRIFRRNKKHAKNS